MTTRRGTTLVEVLIVITTMTIVTTVGAAMVFFLMRAEEKSTQKLLTNSTISRLADRFRGDAGAALDVEVLADTHGTPDRIRLEQPDGQIIFQSDDAGVIRLLKAGDEMRGRETYRLPDSDVLFEVTDDGLLAAIVIRQDRSGSNVQTRGLGPVRELRIESAVGRNRRFERRSADVQ